MVQMVPKAIWPVSERDTQHPNLEYTCQRSPLTGVAYSAFRASTFATFDDTKVDDVDVFCGTPFLIFSEVWRWHGAVVPIEIVRQFISESKLSFQ